MTQNTNSEIWIAGAVAAITVDILVYPLDTLKTRLQSPNYRFVYKHATTGTVNKATLFGGLYQGVWSVVIATIPSSGAFFTSYESLKYLLGSLSGSSKTSSLSFISLPTPLLHSLASSTAELVSCAILTPAEVIKQNAQIASRSPSTAPAGHRHGPKTNITLEVLRKLRRRPARLWSGYTALVARNLPFTGLQFPIYEELKRKLEGWRDEKILLPKQKQMGKEAVAEPDVHVSLHMGTTAVSAGVAGSVAAGVTTPIDVIKTRIMLGAGEERDTAAGVGQQEKLGRDSPGRGGRGKMTLWSVGRDILNKEGVRGLFRGGVLRSAWTALGLGLYLGSYEGGRKFLEYRREGKTKVKCPR